MGKGREGERERETGVGCFFLIRCSGLARKTMIDDCGLKDMVCSGQFKICHGFEHDLIDISPLVGLHVHVCKICTKEGCVHQHLCLFEKKDNALDDDRCVLGMTYALCIST